ncbi:hypothetical protein CARUB_v10021092mg [Capsella rubella]|uniref:Jacalin-type lectin domain-containing protein n=1 Tax=Capsella rubella TaxID=81985 RepID=R0GJC0_9BRAS|nr:hypothetical protein CARUB_v10021092mg [Capsella rubella]
MITKLISLSSPTLRIMPLKRWPRETKQLKLSTQQDGYRIRVKFLYDKDNQTVVGEDHGSHTLLRVDEFELQHPGEYLISVEGGYDDVVDGNKSKFIRMLRFKTNIRTSQLFGLETKPSFKLEKERHKFIEFHGTIGNMLKKIGVHVHYIMLISI